MDPQRPPQNEWRTTRDTRDYEVARAVEEEHAQRDDKAVNHEQDDRAPRKSKIIRKSSRKSQRHLEAVEEAVRRHRETKRSKSRQSVGNSAEVDGRREKVDRPARKARGNSDASDGRRSDESERRAKDQQVHGDDRKAALQEFFTTLMGQIPEKAGEAVEDGKAGRRSRRPSASSRRQSRVVEAQQEAEEDDDDDDEPVNMRQIPGSDTSSEDLSD